MTHHHQPPPPPPTASDVKADGGASTVQSDLDAIRSALQPLSALRINDPNHAGLEIDNTPSTAAPTTDTHRMTFVVPTPDDTVVSFGMAGPRIHETGITGRTKSHVHWQTTEGADTKTVVSLGKPAPSLAAAPPAAEGAGAGEPGPAEGGEGGAATIATAKGYAMFTEGASWEESRQKVTIRSRQEDIEIRTFGGDKNIRVQSDTGRFLAFGEKNCTIASGHGVVIGAQPGLEAEEIGKDEKLGDAWREHTFKQVGVTLSTAAEVATAVLAQIHLIPSTLKKGAADKGIWGATKVLATKPKYVTTAALYVSTILRSAMEVAGYEPAGSVSIFGSKAATVASNIATTLFGGIASSVVSPGESKLLGGVSALVNGGLFAEVLGGLGVGITSIKDVEIVAVKGEIEMEAKKAVVIECEHGPVRISGHTAAQLASHDGSAALYGKTITYVGGGHGAGHGLMASGSFLKFGKISAEAESLTAPTFDDKHGYSQTDSLMQLRMGETIIAMTDSEFALNAGSASRFKLPKAGDVVVDSGGKILIG